MERGSRAAERDRDRERKGRTGRGPRVAMIRAMKRYKRDDVAKRECGEERRRSRGAKWRREDAIWETARRDRAQTARLGSGERGRGEGGTESVAIMTENCALPGSAAQHRHLIQFNCDTVQ